MYFKEAVVQHLYLGRSPPMFTDMRVLRQSTDDDHLVLELGMNFRTADDMIAILAVKLRKRLGFGMWAKLHILGMHIEGKVLIGVKFLRQNFQGLQDGWISSWPLQFEQSLVEPNMLVVDVDKFASPQPENWFTVDEKEPVAHAIVEVVEAADVKPSDLNGLADPYVKGKLGPYRFRTKTQKKTLAPKWHEEFKIPICSWELPNVLTIEVRDKDRFVDDTLGDCSINISDLRDGQRRDMWLSLQNIKMGRLHLAITVVEGSGKGADQPRDVETLDNEYKKNSFASETVQRSSFPSGLSEKSPKVADQFEPIDVEGQQETGIWVHHPGSEVLQIWKPREGKSRLLDNQIRGEDCEPIGSFESSSASYQNDSSSSTDECLEGNKGRQMNKVRRGLRKISSVFHRSPRTQDKSSSIVEPVQSPHANIRAVNAKEIGVKLIVEDNIFTPSSVNVPKAEETESLEGSGPESPSKGNMKGMAKSFLKHAEKSARGIKHAFSGKGVRKSQGDSGLAVTKEDTSVGSESSDESFPSSVFTPRVEMTPIVPNSLSSCGNDSFKSKEDAVPTTPSDAAMNIEDPVNKVSPVGLETLGDHSSSKSERNGAGLVEESSNPKLSDENLEKEITQSFSLQLKS
ncbi:hypothetical protein F0562_009060 [Nyssa sinensis]|uniref:C2 domain-containing protein n=1 Tax=Nyssa sinensis TaxID=561372 RepID=A0A5J5ABK6_9ASTE|nr:hypothetical protein F0562_009060 [Nyssa sinensis]